MIYIDRKAAQVPKIFESQKAKSARKEAEEFFSLPKSKRSQQRFHFHTDIYLAAEVKGALEELFHGKCAYCESRITHIATPDIDHFRPKAQASGIDEKVAPDHYWWLAYEWENLYFSCHKCNRNKRNMFPVVGKRATIGSKGEKLRKERALLIDPCVDQPQIHLMFDGEGMVRSVSHGQDQTSPDYDKGKISIDVLGLNRESLVKARKGLAKEINEHWEIYKRQLLTNVEFTNARIVRAKKLVMKHLDDNEEYVQMARQIIVRRLDKMASTRLDQRVKEQIYKTKEQIYKMMDTLTLSGVVDARTSLQGDLSIAATIRTVYLESVEIHNFKAIRSLNLEFKDTVKKNGNKNGYDKHNNDKISGSESRGESWKMLLGENGTGKSSVLHAVALALTGEERLRNSNRFAPKSILRHGTRKGYVRVHLTVSPKPIELNFSKDKYEFKNDGILSNMFLRGYGPTRLLPNEGCSGNILEKEPRIKVGNLFDPQVPLHNADKWLKSLKRRDFNTVALSIKDLLHLNKKDKLYKERGQVRVKLGETRVSLHELSDGYQSVLALATDIMAGIPEELSDMSYATGIVLLDEIGAHLHPRWRMEIVKSLRRAFPKLQFLVTTHEPLCLRGLLDNEIVVLQLEGEEVTVNDNLPSPEGLRVDQLLTSNLFGLHSTIDPEIDKMFQEYYSLLAIPVKGRSDEQEEKCKNLKQQLAGYGVLGYTRRDQLIYEVIDEYFAKERGKQCPELKKETKRRMLEIWNFAVEQKVNEQ